MLRSSRSTDRRAWHGRLGLAAAAALVLAGALLPATSAAADGYDYYVGCGDDRISVLNYGIINTNAQAGGKVNVILTAGCTYTLTSAYDPVAGNGLPKFTGAGGATLAIYGNGATIERDAGAGAFRFLEVASGATAEIFDVTFLRGHGRDGNPNSSSSTSGQSAGSDGADGGAILNSGTLTLDGAAFYLNVAGAGGGGDRRRRDVQPARQPGNRGRQWRRDRQPGLPHDHPR